MSRVAKRRVEWVHPTRSTPMGSTPTRSTPSRSTSHEINSHLINSMYIQNWISVSGQSAPEHVCSLSYCSQYSNCSFGVHTQAQLAALKLFDTKRLIVCGSVYTSLVFFVEFSKWGTATCISTSWSSHYHSLKKILQLRSCSYMPLLAKAVNVRVSRSIKSKLHPGSQL